MKRSNRIIVLDLIVRITQAIGKLLKVDSKTFIRSQSYFNLQPSHLQKGSLSLIRLLVRIKSLQSKVLLLSNMMPTSKNPLFHRRKSESLEPLPQSKALNYSNAQRTDTRKARLRFIRNKLKHFRR